MAGLSTPGWVDPVDLPPLENKTTEEDDEIYSASTTVVSRPLSWGQFLVGRVGLEQTYLE